MAVAKNESTAVHENNDENNDVAVVLLCVNDPMGPFVLDDKDVFCGFFMSLRVKSNIGNHATHF